MSSFCKSVDPAFSEPADGTCHPLGDPRIIYQYFVIVWGILRFVQTVRNLGKKSLEEVIQKLHSLGLDLKKDEE